VQRLLPHDLLGVLEISETGHRVHIRMSVGADIPPNFQADVPRELLRRIR
jgi:hypothetical protein